MHTLDLEYFFDINTCISLCLHHFSTGRLKVVEYLTTEASANLQCKTNDGETPLDLARSYVYTQKILCMHYSANNSNNHTAMIL